MAPAGPILPLRRAVAAWPLLLALSGGLAWILELLQVPAALLLGPMLAAIAMSASGTSLDLPRLPLRLAQAVVGCLIARSFTPSLFGEMARDWPLFVAAIGGVLVVSIALGWLLARLRLLPGSAAVWGSFPGAATAMTLMADAYGADMRLVAFMQYLRVFLVSLAASLVARLAAHPAAAPAASWFPPLAWLPFAETLALVALGGFLAPRLAIPAGPMLLPLGIGAVLGGAGLLAIELPPWLLAISYAFVGWGIGLRFDRAILAHVARLVPRVTVSILTLIGVCDGFAVLLHVLAGIDPLTAYLATSPGGADSVAIIAASSPVDVPFVMALQTGRFLVVLLIGPRLARFVARRVGP